MKTRNIQIEKNANGTVRRHNVVWFGSYGKNIDGTAKFVKPDKSSYVENDEATYASLLQRLHLIKGELWWNIDFGIPLTDKHRNKSVIDFTVTDIILTTKGVTNIKSYTSYTSGTNLIIETEVITEGSSVKLSTSI